MLGMFYILIEWCFTNINSKNPLSHLEVSVYFSAYMLYFN